MGRTTVAMEGARGAHWRLALGALGLALGVGAGVHAGHAEAQAPLPSGFLCCNLRAAGDWISDINYRAEGTSVIAAGTPVKGTAWGRYSLGLKIGGKDYWLGNDYSRSLDDDQFAARYVVAGDPRRKIAAADPVVRDAIRRSRIMPGMTEDEVAIAIGYPVASYTPQLSDAIWKYWIDRTGEFSVRFDRERRVESVTGDGRVLAVVLYLPSADLVRQAQERLNEYGFEVGEPDGRNGPATRAALRDFQEVNGLKPSGAFDAQTLRRLGVGPQR